VANAYSRGGGTKTHAAGVATKLGEAGQSSGKATFRSSSFSPSSSSSSSPIPQQTGRMI
jgi:hypothetical protein